MYSGDKDHPDDDSGSDDVAGPRSPSTSKVSEGADDESKAAGLEPAADADLAKESYTPFGVSLHGADADAALSCTGPTGLFGTSGGGEGGAGGAGARVAQAQGSNTASSTLSQPDVEEMLTSVGILLHHQMAEELEISDPEAPVPAYDFSGDGPSAATEEPHSVPTMEEINAFLKKTFEIAKWSPECPVVALVYVNRLTGYTNIRLHNANWRPILLCCLLLAQTLWDDKSLATVDFPYLWRQAFPSPSHSTVSFKRVNFMERKFLELLSYNVTVRPSLYAKYFFELRTLREGE